MHRQHAASPFVSTGLQIAAKLSPARTQSARCLFHHQNECARPGGAVMNDIDKPRVVALLNRILEQELAGVVRYTHYSCLLFGFGRIPLLSWLRRRDD